jgi:L-ascorbate 6-phosphate lactonase
MTLKDRIASARTECGEMTVFYLAQAGFYFKTADGKTLCLDAYLGDCCERLFNYKRMVPALISAKELQADLLVATHSHADHLDPDLLECLKSNPKIRFIGSPDCRAVFRQAGIADKRVVILAVGEGQTVDDIEYRAVYADHGDLARDAVGLLITTNGITVYATGDTAYRPREIMDSLGGVKVDIMIAPINSAFGNLGHENAVRLAALIKPKVVIGCHFGMFIAHGGDPGAFLEFAKQALPEAVAPIVMAPGERLLYSVKYGVKEMETQKQNLSGTFVRL